MMARLRNIAGGMIAMQVFALASAGGSENADPATGIVQYGTMHEAIGQQQHQGRAKFADLLKRPHFYAVAALEQLRGEATVLDGQLIVSTVDAEGRLKPVTDLAGDLQATLLVGDYVESWSEHPVAEDIRAAAFDQYVAETATQAGIDTSRPFIFVLEGSLQDVRLHVINGACPLHARLKKVDLAADKRPLECQFSEIQGTVVGVFAEDAVGKLTHPATSTHTHLIYTDPASQVKATGHIEQIGISKGSVLRLPKAKR